MHSLCIMSTFLKCCTIPCHNFCNMQARNMSTLLQPIWLLKQWSAWQLSVETNPPYQMLPVGVIIVFTTMYILYFTEFIWSRCCVHEFLQFSYVTFHMCTVLFRGLDVIRLSTFGSRHHSWCRQQSFINHCGFVHGSSEQLRLSGNHKP